MEAKSLGKFLKARGVISKTDWSTLERACEAKPTEIIKGITALGILSESRLAQILADKTNAEILSDPLTAHLDPEILDLIDPMLLERFEFIPLRLLESGRVLIATANPLDRSVIRQLEFFIDRKISCAIATPTQIQTALEELVADFEAKPSAFRAFISQFTTRKSTEHSSQGRTTHPSASQYGQEEIPSEDSHFDFGELDSLEGDEDVCFDNPDESMMPEDEITLDFGSFSSPAADDTRPESESEPSQTASRDAESPASEDEISDDLKASDAPDEKTDGASEAGLTLPTDTLGSEVDDVNGTPENPDTAELSAPATDEIELDEPSLDTEEHDVRLDEIAADIQLDVEASEEAVEPDQMSPVVDGADELVTELESTANIQLDSENSGEDKDGYAQAGDDQDETAVRSADALLAELDPQLAPDDKPSQSESADMDADDLLSDAELEATAADESSEDDDTGIDELSPTATADLVEETPSDKEHDATMDMAPEAKTDPEPASLSDARQDVIETQHSDASASPAIESGEEETEASQPITKPVGAERRLKRQVSGPEERGQNTAKIGKLNRALMNLQFTRESSEAARTCYEALSVVFSHGLIFRCVSAGEPEVFLVWNASGQQDEIDTDELMKVNAQATKITPGWNEQITVDTEGLAWPIDGEVFVYRADYEGIGPVIWISQASNPVLITTAIAGTCKQILHRFVDFIKEVRS